MHLLRNGFVALSVVLSVFGGACTPEPCEDPGVVVALAGPDRDPTLGSFEGSLSWLQTEENVAIHLAVVAQSPEVQLHCGYGGVDVQLDIATADGLIMQTLASQAGVSESGLLLVDSFSFEVDHVALIEGGKVPEAPDILDRDPSALVDAILNDEGAYDLTLTLYSATDRIHVAIGSLHKEMP